MPRHLPSVVGCAFGFAMAGCGIGSLVGTGVGAKLAATLPEGERTPLAEANTLYGWLWGVALTGMVVGGAAGMAYAKFVRRRRAVAADPVNVRRPTE